MSMNFSRISFLCWVKSGDFYKPSEISWLKYLIELAFMRMIDRTQSKPFKTRIGCFSYARLLSNPVSLRAVKISSLIWNYDLRDVTVSIFDCIS